ncbi:MAG: TonB-dependent receptor [Pseudohongiellaceae bacterium]
MRINTGTRGANSKAGSATGLLGWVLCFTLLNLAWSDLLLAQNVAQGESQEERLDEEDSEEEDEIEEITVTTTRNRRSFDEQPTRVEVLGGEEINEKANMKPGDIRMLLNESTGIHVQQTSATSFNSSIRIQGLDGKYTQILRDGMPLYGGFSGGLSLLQIAPLDLQRVEVIKGASSTLYGGGAISGLVNLISRSPGTEPETALLLNLTSADGVDTSGFYSGWHDDFGTTVFTSYNRSEAYDPADIGLSAIPEFERWTFNPRLFFEGANTDASLGVSAVVEDRLGGDMEYIDGDKTRPAYFEDSATKRLSTQAELVRQLPAGSELVLRNSFSHFRRELAVPDFTFSGTQLSSFSEAHVLGATGSTDWVAGFNLWTEDYEQEDAVPGFRHDFNSHTLGSFVQTTFPLTTQFTVETGLRFDHTSDYGNFLLPRVSLLYTPAPNTTLRIGGGLGYKEPTLFTEEAEMHQYQGVLPLEPELLDAERSAGLNLDVNRSFELSGQLSLDLNLLLFYTRVDDPLRLVPQGEDRLAFRQPDDYLDTRGTEINAVWSWENLRFFLGYTYADVREHRIDGVHEYPLVPEHRVNNVLVYEREDDLRIGLEAYYYGPQTLNDGSRSRDYWIVGLMMEKIMREDFSVFLNFENFSDTRQTRYGPLYSGSLSNPVFNDIYAPLDGFVINGGIKLRL